MWQFKQSPIRNTKFQKPSYLLYDSFNRSDSVPLGKADTGQTWLYFGSSSWSIQNNKAYCTDTSNTAFVAYQPTQANAKVTAKITFGTNEGLAVRAIDGINYITARISPTGLGLYRIVSGAANTLGTYTFTPVSGNVYSVKVTCSGTTIRVFLDGVERITVTTETFNQTVINHGLRSVSSSIATTGRYDDFIVEAN